MSDGTNNVSATVDNMEGGGPSPTQQTVAGLATFTKKLSGTRKVLTLADLPQDVADALRSLDTDGDGTIDVAELHTGARDAAKSIQKTMFFRKLFIILFGIWCVRPALMREG